MFGLPPPIPDPPLVEGNAPFPDAEVVVLPAPAGRRVTLSFASPYEPYLTLDDGRVLDHPDADTRRLVTWMARRLPALFRALELRYGLLGVLDEGEVIVLDALDRESDTFVDHGRLRQLLGQARVKLPAFAILGSVANRGELGVRLRSMFAAGTSVEVRHEDGGRVVARRRMLVGR